MMTMYDAYISNIKQILRNGDLGVTEDGEAVITSPIPITSRFNRCLISKSPYGIQEKGLDAYKEQFVSRDKGGFDYTYGNRLRAYFGVDQYNDLCWMLLNNPGTRRAIMTTNDPKHDNEMKNRPCLQYVQVYQDPHNPRYHKMYVMFRSHDMLSAWFANMKGLDYMASCINIRAEIHIDEIRCTSVIPHIYYMRDKDVLMRVCRDAGIKCPEF